MINMFHIEHSEKMSKNIVADVLRSVCEVDIMNELASANNGIRKTELKPEIISDSTDLEHHLKKLTELGLVNCASDVCILTDKGKKVYKTMQEVARTIPEL